MKKMNTKNVLLSVAAFILVAVTVVGVTYSWIDDVKLVQFQNADVSDGAPLKTGVDINANVNITSADTSVNLGNLLGLNDYTYSYSDGDNQKTHIRYDGSNDDSKKPNWNTINQNKGYFYESGDMHLSPCYSDGETFYFPTSQENVYREGNKDDENVNYISFTVKVSSPEQNVDLWFEDEPTICYLDSNDTLQPIEQARFAISIDGKSHIYSPTGEALTCNNDLNATTVVQGVRKTTEYTYNHSDNDNARGTNSNVLFSIKKGGTVTMNVKIWLEGGYDTNITASNINFKLISSRNMTREFVIVDRTTSNSKKSWLDDDGATMYLTFPSVLDKYMHTFLGNAYDIETAARWWDDLREDPRFADAPFYELKKDAETSTAMGFDVLSPYIGSTKVEIPYYFNGEEMIIFRCTNQGWNTYATNNDNQIVTPKRSDYKVYAWNWWQTTIPNAYSTGVYTLYGGSHDQYAAPIFTDDAKKNTDLGYGTWGDVVTITVEQSYNGVNWAPKEGNNYNVYIRDYTDADTTGESYIHSMYWDTGSSKWTATIPKSSVLLQFDYTKDQTILGCYGYNSYNRNNPQQRPEGSFKYTFTFKRERDNNNNGMGYWEGANHIYLIKNGDFASESTLDAYIYYEYFIDNNNNTKKVQNAEKPGVALSAVANVNYKGAAVYQSQEFDTPTGLYPDRHVSGYKYDKIDTQVVFNNGTDSTKTKDLLVFPGCYFNPAGNEWLGSLNGKGRAAAIIDSGDDSGDSGGGGGTTDHGSMTGFTTETNFVFKISGKEYKAYANSGNTEYRVNLPLKAGDNWTTVLEGSTNYGLEQASQYFTAPGGSVNINSAHKNNFSFRAFAAGNYVIQFTKSGDTLSLTSLS